MARDHVYDYRVIFLYTVRMLDLKNIISKMHNLNRTLFILGVVAIICSRTMFSFFNDPEGPNLLVVMVMAVIIYVLSLALYGVSLVIKRTVLDFTLNPFLGRTEVFIVIAIQVIITATFYFCLN